MKFGIFVNSEKEFSFKVTKEIMEIAQKFNVKCEVADSKEEYDFIVSLGGDGTFLAANRTFLGTPIFGINLGHLGFLAEAEIKDIGKVVTKLINKEYRVEERGLLEAIVNDKKMIALNDIVISRINVARLLELNLKFNGKRVDNYKADGLIIATPTGSTAYSLSAGGPIVDTQLDVTVVTPICAHSLHQRPIIADANTLINIDCDTNDFLVTADGQISGEGKDVTIKKSELKARIIKLSDKCFFDIVREKFRL